MLLPQLFEISLISCWRGFENQALPTKANNFFCFYKARHGAQTRDNRVMFFLHFRFPFVPVYKIGGIHAKFLFKVFAEMR
jgi:hypothetical protein